MARRTVLVVEDDAPIRRGVTDALRFGGFDVLEAERGDDGLETALTADCDLVLLDLMLPGRPGLEVLGELRDARPTLPVIILTARGDEDDRVEGLRLGADDYVVKPFSVKELLARVEAVLRRSPERPTDVPEVAVPGGLADLVRREVRFTDGRTETLSEREADLLRYLAMHAGRPVSREELLGRVWRIPARGTSTRTVDMHVSRLRDKLGDGDGTTVRTVRGRGYLFDGEDA